MNEVSGKRRLAAIMAADMVGFSRLMHQDETGTLARQKQYLDNVIRPQITAHDGRLVKTTGDGVLVEFPSAVEALSCSAAIQREMSAREADTPEDRQIAYRIGINLGEVIPDGDDIFGDGVNVAARLEGLAEPGGILISDTVFRTVQGKLELGFENLGPLEIRNIDEPVNAYHVLLDPEDAGLVLAADPPRRSRLPLMVAVAALIAVLVVISGFFVRDGGPDDPPPPIEPQTLRLLVLPYAAADPTASIYADAVSENLWLTLSRLRGTTIVRREAALTLKGIDPTPEQIAQHGAVSHILRGDVTVADGSVTIASRLLDSEGQMVWQQQDTVTSASLFAALARHKTGAVSALKIPLNANEREILEDRFTSDPSAFLQYAQGVALRDTGHWNNFPQALRLFASAGDADPEFVDARTAYAGINLMVWIRGWNNVRNTLEAVSTAEAVADEVLAGDPTNAEALSVKVFISIYQRHWDEAVTLARGAVFNNAAAPELREALGWALLANGDEDLARAEFEAFAEMSPRLSVSGTMGLAGAYLRLSDPEPAVVLLRGLEDQGVSPFLTGWLFAEAFARMGDVEAAKSKLEPVFQGWPVANQTWLIQLNDFYRNPAVMTDLFTHLQTAGLPRWPFDYDRKHAEFRLDNAALKDLYEPGFKSIHGKDELGGEMEQEFRADGSFRLAPGFLPFEFNGTWRIVDDQVCLTVPDLYKGRETCEQVYRDPERPAWRFVQLNGFGTRRLGVTRTDTGTDR